MSDQAQALREMIQTQPSAGTRMTRIITVTSGKGGVGKSNFTLNFALALQALKYKVLIFDADIGLANIDVLMGVHAEYNLYHLLKRQKTIWEIIHKGHRDLLFISGGSGFNDLLRLSEEELNHFVDQLNQLNGFVDFILFDTGAGLSKETLKFILSSHETIVVTTPEPTSITDAYAIIKMVHAVDNEIPFHLVVNRITDLKEGKRTAEKISLVAKRFLNMDIPTLGYIADDGNVSKAVKKQIPFTIAYPDTSASLALTKLAQSFISGKKTDGSSNGGVRGFLNRMMKLIK